MTAAAAAEVHFMNVSLGDKRSALDIEFEAIDHETFVISYKTKV